MHGSAEHALPPKHTVSDEKDPSRNESPHETAEAADLPPGSNSGAAASKGTISPITAVHKEIQMLAEKVAEDTVCVNAHAQMIQAKMRSCLNRTAEEALENLVSEVQAMNDHAMALDKLQLLRKDHAKVLLYSKKLSECLDVWKDKPGKD